MSSTKPISCIGERNLKGRVVVEVEKKDNIQKVGSIWVATLERKDNIEHFDPHYGIVIGGKRNGQKALFHRLAYKQSLRGESRTIFCEGEKTFLVLLESDIYLYINEGEIEMSGGWCLCDANIPGWEVIEAGGQEFLARKHSSGLYLGKGLANKEEIIESKLLFVSKEVSDEFGVKVGDVLYLDKASDVPLEDDLNQQLDKKYFRVHINDVLGIKV